MMFLKHLGVPFVFLLFSGIYSAFLWRLQLQGEDVNSGAWWFGNSVVVILGTICSAISSCLIATKAERELIYSRVRERVLTCIKNFEQIPTIQSGKRQFSGPAHRNAVMVQSFEVLDESIDALSKCLTLRLLLWRLKSISNKQRKLDVNSMQPGRLIELTKKLSRFIGGTE